MSKLINELKITDGIRYRPERTKLTPILQVDRAFEILGTESEYWLNVTIGARGFTKTKSLRGNEWETMNKMLISQIREGIFGEYREPLMLLRMAIDDRREEDAMQILLGIYASMFEE